MLQIGLPRGQEMLQGAARTRLDQHLRPFHIGHALHAHRHRWVEGDGQLQLGQPGVTGLAGGIQKILRRFLAARLGPHQRLEAERWQTGLAALAQLLLGEGREIVLLQGFKQRVRRVKGLHPHFARAGSRQFGVAARPSSGLHQQGKQALGGAKVGGKQSTVGVQGRHQGDAAKVVALGHHLRADQHIDVAVMHLGQLAHQLAFQTGGVGVNAGDAQRRSIGAFHVRQQLGQMLFQPFGAVAKRADVLVATARASTRHGLGQAAMVAAQRAVGLVEHPVGTAMRAFAFPAAGSAMQYRRITPAVEQQQHLLLPRQALAHGGQQRG